MSRRRLELWSGRASADTPAQLTLVECLYAPPNPDRSRKACGNCLFWLPEREECFLHDASVTATADSVCGYHVFGAPMEPVPSRENMAPVTPELSGLEQVPDGTSCDSCAHYSGGEQSGVCGLLWDKTDGTPVPAEVQALGCCCAWQAKESDQ